VLEDLDARHETEWYEKIERSEMKNLDDKRLIKKVYEQYNRVSKYLI